jgi:alpha-ribazole phosphatase
MNSRKCYCGVTDIDLSSEGREGVLLLKKHIEDREFDVIYTSPLKRAVQTATLLGLDYQEDERLKEMNFGIFEGLNYKDAFFQYPAEYNKWNEKYMEYCIPCGESLNQVYDRTKDFILDISRRHSNVIAVTHGGIIRCALSFVLGSLDFFYKFRIDPGTISIISESDGYFYVKALNIGYMQYNNN